MARPGGGGGDLGLGAGQRMDGRHVVCVQPYGLVRALDGDAVDQPAQPLHLKQTQQNRPRSEPNQRSIAASCRAATPPLRQLYIGVTFDESIAKKASDIRIFTPYCLRALAAGH
jgi:hypothetical protein